MMDKKLYQLISSIIEARENCERLGNIEWRDKHEMTLEQFNGLLPSGSGVDCGTKIDLLHSRPKRLLLTFGYHHMDENGYYDGWTNYTAIVTPSLSNEFDLRITGSDRNQLKDYLYDLFDQALRESVGFDDDRKEYFIVSWREAAQRFQVEKDREIAARLQGEINKIEPILARKIPIEN